MFMYEVTSSMLCIHMCFFFWGWGGMVFFSYFYDLVHMELGTMVMIP